MAIAAFVTAGCAGTESDEVRYPFGERYPVTHTIERAGSDDAYRLESDGYVELDSVYQIRDLIAVQDRPDGTYFLIADRSAGRLVRLDENGTFLGFAGRPGAGPGELDNLTSVASFGDRIAGIGRGGRINLYGMDGEPAGVIRIPGLIYLNSNLLMPDASTIVAGGFLSGENGPRDGTLGHVMSVAGDSVRIDFEPMPSRIWDLDADVFSGLNMAWDPWNESVWAVQLTQYAVAEYALDGTLKRRIEVIPKEYEYDPVSERRPEGQAEMAAWFQGFDTIPRIYALDESTIAVVVTENDTRTHWLDLIDHRAMTILDSIEHPERVDYIDPVERVAYIESDHAGGSPTVVLSRYRLVRSGR